MKIYLDLLPEEKKEEIKRKKIFLSALGQETLFILPMAVFILFLCGVDWVLKIQAGDFEKMNALERSQQNNQELDKYEKKFSEINATVESYSLVHKDHMVWFGILREINSIVPAEIYLNNLSSKDYKIFITGKAKKREDLLGFKDKLSESDCFANINIPLSNFVAKNDVDFQMDVDIKESCLKANK